MTDRFIMVLRLAWLFTVVLLPIWPCSAQIDRLRNLYELLAKPDASEIPDPEQLTAILAEQMPKGTPAELRTIVPVVLECLKSRGDKVRTVATVFLIALSTRVDSAQVLEPYDDYLIGLLDEKDERTKTGAMYLLTGVFPRPSAKALIALHVRLNDPQNTGDQFQIIARSLLSAFPADPAIIHKVVTAAGTRPPKEHPNDGIMQVIGIERITNEEALEFLRAGFQEPSSRFSSVEALSHLPKEIRNRFASELQRAAEDPAEIPEVRSAARTLLTQP